MTSIFDDMSDEQKKFVRAIIENTWSAIIESRANQDKSVLSIGVQNTIIERTDAAMWRHNRAGLMNVLREALFQTKDASINLRAEEAAKAVIAYGYDHVDRVYDNLLDFVAYISDPSGGVAPDLTVRQVLTYMKEDRGRSEFKVRYGYTPKR